MGSTLCIPAVARQEADLFPADAEPVHGELIDAEIGLVDADVLHRQDRIEAICRSEEHTSELQSLMRISYAVFCLKKKKRKETKTNESSEITSQTKHK